MSLQALNTGIRTGFVSDSIPKVGQMAMALGVFFAVLLLVFLLAARAKGRAQTPLALLIFLGPAVLLLLIGLVMPAIRTITLSFFNSGSDKFIGGKNFGWAFTDPDMRRVLFNTVLWLLIAPALSTGLGLMLALLIDRMKHESVPKSFMFMPMAISFVGASIIWKFVYDYRDPAENQIGLLNQVALWVGWKHPPNWLLTIPLNTFLLMVIMIWVQVGFAMVVLSAAIKAIPGDIIEAAALDGATGTKLFRTVTIPMIRNTLIVVFTTILIAVLKIFDIVRTTTGGNFSTGVLANEMYTQTFGYYDAGRGSALAVILFIGVAPVLVYNVSQLRKERASR